MIKQNHTFLLFDIAIIMLFLLKKALAKKLFNFLDPFFDKKGRPLAFFVKKAIAKKLFLFYILAS